MSREIREAIAERIRSDDFKRMERAPKKKRKAASPSDYARIMKVARAVVGLVLVAVLISATIYYYNQYKAALVWLDHDKALWDNEIQRRASLLPKLIVVSAKYSEHEKILFEYVTQMRGNLGKGNGELASNDKPDSPLNKLMTSLLAVSEQYPNLKATQSFEQLMKEWVETEDRVAQARTSYIRRVKTLNDLFAKFPSNVFGWIFAKNTKQWKIDESTPLEIDVEKMFQKFIEERAKTQAAVEPTPASVPETAAELKSTNVPETAAEPKPVASPQGRLEPDRTPDAAVHGNDATGGKDADASEHREPVTSETDPKE